MQGHKCRRIFFHTLGAAAGVGCVRRNAKKLVTWKQILNWSEACFKDISLCLVLYFACCSGAGHGGNSFEEHHAAGADRDHPQLPQGEYDQRAGQARGLAPWGGQRGQRVLWWPGPPPFCIHSCGGRHSWTSPLLWGGSAGWSWLWVRLLPVPVGNWWNTGRFSSDPPTHTRLNSLWEPWNPPKDPSESGHLCRSEAKVANKNNFPHDLEICSVTFCIWERTQNFIRRIFSLGQFAECSALFPPCGTLLISSF